MGKVKQVVMASEYDDMGGIIKEIALINQFIESSGWGEVDLPEGFGGDCAE